MLNQRKNEPFHFGLGIFLILIVLINQTLHVRAWSYWVEILWYCNAGTLGVGLGFLWKKRLLFSWAFITALPAQFLWIVDYFLIHFSTESLGRTERLYTASSGHPVVLFISVLLHGILIPVSAYGIYRYGFSRWSIVAAYPGLFALFVPTYYLSDYKTNINCVFYPCDMKMPTPFQVEQFGYGSLNYLLGQIFVWSLLITTTYVLLLGFTLFYSRLKEKEQNISISVHA